MSNCKKLIENVGQVYYINLEQSTDRRESFEKNWSEALDANKLTRIEAVSPKTYGDIELIRLVEANQRLANPEPYRIVETTQQRLFEACCALSHADAIMKAVYDAEQFFNTNVDALSYVAIIAEDDAVVSDKITYTDFANLNYQINNYNNFDILQLGYTVFVDNVSGWLLEREYRIDAVSMHNGFAQYSHGIFGTLCYMIKIKRHDYQKWHQLADELRSGVIADFCIATSDNLKKWLYKEKIVVPTGLDSTIGSDSTYNAIDAGYLVNVFDRQMIRESVSSEQTCVDDIVMHIDTRHSKRRLYYFAYDKSGQLVNRFISNHRTYQGVLANQIDSWLKSRTEDALHNDNIEVAYIVEFNNLLRPHLGKKTYVKGAPSYVKH
jgi:hypothetical protein